MAVAGWARGASVRGLALVALVIGGCATGAATTDEGAADGGAGAPTSDAAAGREGGGGSTGAPTADAGPAFDAGSPSGSAGDGSAGDGGGGNKPTGSFCQADGDCASGLCKPVLLGQSVCVAPCSTNADCATITGSFCESTAPGAATGYCVPNSPAHCLSCSVDADCGSLSEVCMVGPGDDAKACHVDCDLAGQAACPSDYACTQVSVGGGVRKLCLPNVGTCLDAVGGYCTRVGVPQACTRANGAGRCVGQRVCLAQSGRYDACNAPAPQCKPTCATQDAAGCATSFCPSATSTPTDCGACGNVCPGIGKPFDDVRCASGGACALSCQGEHYDVDGDPNDGCEAQDSPLDVHTQAKASYVGDYPCTDSSSQQHIAGGIPSDARVHQNGAIDGFNGTTGAAPDWFRIHANGGTCQNDLNLTLTVSGNPGCYRMTAITNKQTQACVTDGTGACSISNGSGSYGDDTDIFVVVEKTCGTSAREIASYTVTGHL